MGEMIDRLAGFISKRRRGTVSPQMEARLTMELLREPTAPMLDEGSGQITMCDGAVETPREQALDAWQAMIDAA